MPSMMTGSSFGACLRISASSAAMSDLRFSSTAAMYSAGVFTFSCPFIASLSRELRVCDTRRVPSPIRALRVEHLNIVHEDYDATVAHYGRLFGGVVVFDRLQPTWHACLMAVGGVLFEIFVP